MLTTEMSTFELSRWCALFEAVNFISDECIVRKRDFDTIKLEPLYIRKFVEGKCDKYARQIETHRENEEISKVVRAQYDREFAIQNKLKKFPQKMRGIKYKLPR